MGGHSLRPYKHQINKIQISLSKKFPLWEGGDPLKVPGKTPLKPKKSGEWKNGQKQFLETPNF